METPLTQPEAELRRTPLYDRHVEAGGRMVPFAGFEMPVQYASILDEHRAVRSRAGLFDVSHMGEFRVCGEGALDFAQRVFTNDLLNTQSGRARYGLLCLPDGGVVDDVTAYVFARDEVLFCVNASNISADRDWLRAQLVSSGLGCELVDESDETALLALQGPLAEEILGELLPPDAARPRPWRFARLRVAGVPTLLAATGYTGERGFELYCASEAAVRLWDALRAAGGPRLTLAGLGARDTLRTEMAYPLYGHELSRERNPIEAGLERFCAFGRGFIGESALQAVSVRGPARRLVGLLVEGRQVARQGYPILGPEAERDASHSGCVTSGTFSPTVERSIAIGYVPAGWATVGTRLHVEVRGRPVPCQVTKTPFYRR